MREIVKIVYASYVLKQAPNVTELSLFSHEIGMGWCTLTGKNMCIMEDALLNAGSWILIYNLTTS